MLATINSKKSLRLTAFIATFLMATPVFAEDMGLGDLGRPDDYDLTIKSFQDNVSRVAAPTAWDWRDHGGVTPPKSQGFCGSCWAFTSAGVLESKLLIEGYGEYDLSEQFPVSCDTAQLGCMGGWAHSLRFWETEGPMLEICTGYPSVNGFTYPCSDFDHCEQKQIYAEDYYTVDVSIMDDIKASVLDDGPAWFSFLVHQDWRDFWNTAAPGTVYVNSVANLLAGHAVLLIGWDDNKGAWLVKNSHGATNGPEGDGTFWIAYSGHANNLDFSVANLDTLIVEDVDDCTCDVGCDDVRTEAGSLDTTDAVCYEIDAEIKGWTAWNVHGRTIEVNDVVVNQSDPLPPPIDGKYYFGFSAGDYPWCGFTHWTW